MKSLATDYRGLPYSLTPTQIRNTVNHAVDGRTTISARYRLLDRNLAPVATGAVGPLGDLGDLSGWVVSSTQSHDATQEVHRTCALVTQTRIGATLGPCPYNPNLHRIQVFADYWDSSGNLLFEVPVGIFWASLGARVDHDWGFQTTYAMDDLSGKISRLVFLNPWVVKAGTNVGTAIAALATADYIPIGYGGTGQTPDGLPHCGPAIPSSRIFIEPTTATVPMDIEFALNTSQLTAMNTLADSAVYKHVYFDSMGNFRTEHRTNFSLESLSPEWDYHTGEDSIIAPGSITDAPVNAPQMANVIEVISEPSGAARMTALVVNQSSDSVNSINNRGEAVPLVIVDNNLPTQALVNQRAAIEAQMAAGLAEQVTFATMPNPFHENLDILGMTATASDGTVLLSSTTGWQERGWTLDLHARTQSHTLFRIIRVG